MLSMRLQEVESTLALHLYFLLVLRILVDTHLGLSNKSYLQ